MVDDLSTGSLANLAEARASVATGVSSELRIHTLDAGSESLADLIALRRPREIYHLAVLPRHDAAPTALGRSFTSMLGVLEAARRNGVTKVIVALPATSLYGHPAARDLPVKEGALAPRGCPRSGGQGGRRAAQRLPRHAGGSSSRPLATATVYGPRQRSDGGVVAAAARRRPAQRGAAAQRRRSPDARLRVRRRRRRRAGAIGAAGERTRRQRRHRRADLAARPVVDGRPGGPAPTFSPARPDELIRFAASPVRARIHLAWSPWTTLEEGLSVR